MTNEIGHNQPPSQLVLCNKTAEDISAWLANHPVILTEEEAKEAKLYLDRGKLGLKDMNDERDKAVRPLNEQVNAINESYRPTKVLLSRIVEEVGKRITSFIFAEEAKRIKAANEAARLAREAEERAKAAEIAEREARDNASVGELGIDLKSATAEADSAFREYEKAERAAQIAEKETNVKVTGGFSRAASLRTTTTYRIKDLQEAFKALGGAQDVQEGILKAAKAYHKFYKKLPPGIEIETERKV